MPVLEVTHLSTVQTGKLFTSLPKILVIRSTNTGLMSRYLKRLAKTIHVLELLMLMINKGFGSNKMCMELPRDIFWESVKSNFHLIARYIPGKDSYLPDVLSRTRDQGSLRICLIPPNLEGVDEELPLA